VPITGFIKVIHWTECCYNVMLPCMKMPSTRRIRQIIATLVLAGSVALISIIVIKQFRSNPPESTSKPISPEIDMSLARLNFSEMRGDEKLWDLTADRADYDKDTGAAKLAAVKVEIFQGKAGGIMITSETGNYLENQHIVTLYKNVHAVTKKGMVFDTEQLEYRTKAAVINSIKPVKVVDGRLTLNANSMEMYLDSENVRFKGKVDAIIEGYHAKH